MTEKLVMIKNRAGIHTRPAGIIAKAAEKFASKITLIREAENEYINAKSVMGIIALGALYNTTLLVRAEGPDEADAVQAISDLFERRFEEE
jgi:phosphocarrier protein